MRVLHVSDMKGEKGGGEYSYVRWLTKRLDRDAEEDHVTDWWAPSHDPATDAEEMLALWNPRHRRALRREIRRFRPDVLHVHGFYHRLSGAALGAVSATGVPAVLTAHAFGSVCPRLSYVRVGHGMCEEVFPSRACFGPCMRHEPLRNLVRYPRLYLAQGAIGRHVARILAPSEYLTSILARRFPDLPCQHVPHPIPLDRPEKPRPEARSRRCFLYVGRILKSKGINVAIRALAALPNAGSAPPVLRIAGDGPDDDEARRLVAALGVADRVQFLGHLSRDEVLEEMRKCLALVVPSPIPETGPLVVLEAFAVAAPVIATSHGGAAELVRNEETGFLVDPGRVEALAAGLRRIADLPAAEYRQMLEEVHRRALDFLPERHYDRVLKAYREAIELGSERRS